MSSSKAEQAWAGLNARQQLYLSTIFEFDQAAEADITAAGARWEKTPPTSEWRQITYDIKLPRELAGYSSVQDKLRKAGQHDSGSGSSLAALKRGGLVSVTHDMVYIAQLGIHVPRVRVRLTTLGRATARHGAGVTAPATTPRGLVARWSCVALAWLYAAGETGLSIHTDTWWDRADRAPSWNTLLRLRDRKDGSFIEEFATASATGTGRYRVRLSDAGRRHFELHHACYRELYPDLDLAETAEQIDGAHAGLADHRTTRPRHLVRDTDLPVLAKLIELEAKNACHLRRVAIEEYERIGQAVPDDVRAIPPGLLRWQVKDLTRTEKSIDRLATRRDGPLVKVIDAPNGPFHQDTHPTLPLVVLTDHGRAHYARYLDEYQRTYPEAHLPQITTPGKP